MSREVTTGVLVMALVMGCSTHRSTEQGAARPPCEPAVRCGTQGKLALQAKRYSEAQTLFGYGCDGGDTTSCWGAGVMFAHGAGVSIDLDRAEGWFRRGCALGDARACEAVEALPEDLPPLDEE